MRKIVDIVDVGFIIAYIMSIVVMVYLNFTNIDKTQKRILIDNYKVYLTILFIWILSLVWSYLREKLMRR